MYTETLRQRLYANSPHDLASDADNTYRDAIDNALDTPSDEIEYTAKSIILSRADIDSLGYDSSTLSNEQFAKIGDKAGEYIMENWWEALEQLCQDHKIKPLKDSIPL